jgi:hypothetical protein
VSEGPLIVYGASLVRPCGCEVTYDYGHTHTRLCAQHRRETFEPGKAPARAADDNLDLVGG